MSTSQHMKHIGSVLLAAALGASAPAFAQGETVIGAAAPLTGPRANLGA